MTDPVIWPEFERAWASFRASEQTASRVELPNSEDEEFMKMAVVGFLRHEKIEKWGRDHFKVAKEYLRGCEELHESTKEKKFAMLGLGGLLGLYSIGKLDDRTYLQGTLVLPGFILSKGGKVEEL